jgi:hypothetical protein
MYILRIHIALNQADGLGHFKNPDLSQEHIGCNTPLGAMTRLELVTET